MKFVVAFVAVMAVANGSVLGPLTQLGQVIAALHNPHTDAATADALHQQLLDILGVPEFPSLHPASIEPAFIDFPVPEAAVKPTVADSPLVQIVVNVNPKSTHPNPVAVVNPDQTVEEKPVISPVFPIPVIKPPTGPIVPIPVIKPPTGPIIPVPVIKPPTGPIVPIPVIKPPTSPIVPIPVVEPPTVPEIPETPIKPEPAIISPPVLPAIIGPIPAVPADN